MPSPTPSTTALLDQIGAAATDARRQLDHIAVRQGDPVTITHPHPWLTRQLHQLAARFAQHRTTCCPHVLRAPTVVFAAAWAPGHIACMSCLHTLNPTGREDLTCDRCRKHFPTLHNSLANYGPILFAYGLCTPCHKRIEPAQRKANHK